MTEKKRKKCRKFVVKKSKNVYHLSCLWIFMHKRWSTNMIPHLSRKEGKYNTLKTYGIYKLFNEIILMNIVFVGPPWLYLQSLFFKNFILNILNYKKTYHREFPKENKYIIHLLYIFFSFSNFRANIRIT